MRPSRAELLTRRAEVIAEIGALRAHIETVIEASEEAGIYANGGLLAIGIVLAPPSGGVSLLLSMISGLLLASSVRKEQRRREKEDVLSARLDQLECALDAIDLQLIDTP